MPKKNGREICDEIKKIKPDIIIFTSGYTRDIILDKGMTEGFKFEFIPKPICNICTPAEGEAIAG